jgi:hypothetical protein
VVPEKSLAALAARSVCPSGPWAKADERLQVVNGALRRADELERRGNKVEAHKLWNSVISLYGSSRDFEVQVEYARKRLAGEEVEPLDLEEPEEDGGDEEERG